MDKSGEAGFSQEFTGTVIWFDNKAGYGFIEREGEKDLFVHFSDIVCEGFKTLKKGQKVTYGLGENNKGQPKAIEVTAVDEAKEE
jgi:CspA family cold shock protein